jgi:NAD(P)-dependent dehydrogenase (short-subunit alcohol dehydrogenase family)
MPAIVTGGASGLGLATAAMLAANGAKVSIFDLDQDSGQAVARDLGAHFVRVDVTDEQSVVNGIASAKREHSAARILVNCAGIAPSIKTVGRDGEPHPLAAFRRAVEINLIGTFLTLSRAAAGMTALDPLGEERGVIVNTASVAAFEGQIGQIAYAASKGGVVAMTLAAARDLAREQIRVVTVAPGIFWTPMLAGLPQAAQESLGKQVPHPSRLGRPEEFAHMIKSIIENPMINGETIRLDGAIRMAPR